MSCELIKPALRPLGTRIVAVAGVLQLIFWFVAWANWLGGLNAVPMMFLTPGVLISQYLGVAPLS